MSLSLSMCAAVAACSPPSVSETAEGPTVMVDAESPVQRLTIVSCMNASPEDRGSASVSVTTELARLDRDAPATLVVSAFERADEEASSERLVDLPSAGAPDDDVEEWVNVYAGDLDWSRADGQWCASVDVELRHLQGVAVEANLEATLHVDYWEDEPTNLSVRIETTEDN